MARSSALLELPTELVDPIVDYIISLEDLKSLCLTCKTLRDLATPRLYETICLQLRKLDYKLQRSLNASNASLQHTQVLRVLDYTSSYSHDEHGKYLGRLLQSLPRDSEALQIIDLDTAAYVPLEMTFLIHLRQKHLKNLVSHHPGPSQAIQPWYRMDELSNISIVTLTIVDLDDCARGLYLLQNVPRLENLSIQLHMEDHHSESEVAGVLFEPWIRHNPTAKKLQLKVLTLRAFNFVEVASDIPKMVEVPTITTLKLYGCASTDLLIRNLLPNNLDLEEFQDDVCCDLEFAGAANHDDLLRGMKRLRSIWLGLANDSPMRFGYLWDSIRLHGPNLCTLFLDDCCGQKDPFFNRTNSHGFKAFGRLCAQCPLLEELAMRPSTEQYEDFLQCLERLTNLVSLRLIVYPASLDKDFPQVNHGAQTNREKALRNEMEVMANGVFSRLTKSCSRLYGLVIEARERGQDCDCRDETRRYAFIRSREIDALGNTTVTASPIAPYLIRVHQPGSSIFADCMRR